MGVLLQIGLVLGQQCPFGSQQLMHRDLLSGNGLQHFDTGLDRFVDLVWRRRQLDFEPGSWMTFQLLKSEGGIVGETQLISHCREKTRIDDLF